jgi:hypothetical protein
MKSTLTLGAIVLLASISVDAASRLNIRVSPAMASAPADIRIYVRVEPREENRILRVSADSVNFFRSSEVQLDGEAGQRVSTFTFRQLPAGDYEVRAELIVSSGRTTQMEVSRVAVFQ